jgi:hypothetical protein
LAHGGLLAEGGEAEPGVLIMRAETLLWVQIAAGEMNEFGQLNAFIILRDANAYNLA